jgi:hypothetical protein
MPTAPVRVRQLTAWSDQLPGSFAAIAEALRAARVNVSAFSTAREGSLMGMHLVVNQHEKAKEALLQIGMRISEEEVLRITLPDRAGQLAKVSSRLEDAHIALEYAYAATARGCKSAELILSVSDLAGAEKALKKL